MELVFAEIASYRELCEFWDLDEVADAHELLVIRDNLRPDPTA